MLYTTTRNRRDAYTAQRSLREFRGPDGGQYVPFRAPEFTQADLDAIAEMSFGQCLAEILNRLFHSKYTGWEIDFAIGRDVLRLVPLGRSITVAELWHNPGWSYTHMARTLANMLGQEHCAGWLGIALRIAALFGIYGRLLASGVEQADICVLSGDFSDPISAWYARQWGLPVGNIIICCNENREIWNLLCQGQLRTNAISTSTCIPNADVALPEHLERLICESGGTDEVARYLDVCRRGGVYVPSDRVLDKMRSGISVSVISSDRIAQTIHSVYKTQAYVLGAESALTYAGLMDYRGQTGKLRNTVILADTCPTEDNSISAFAAEIFPQILK